VSREEDQLCSLRWPVVVADFDGGTIISNARVLLLGAADRAIGLIDRPAACFADGRAGDRIVHAVPTLVGQQVLGIAPSRAFWPCSLRESDR
jgi:hypothetical protein